MWQGPRGRWAAERACRVRDSRACAGRRGCGRRHGEAEWRHRRGPDVGVRPVAVPGTLCHRRRRRLGRRRAVCGAEAPRRGLQPRPLLARKQALWSTRCHTSHSFWLRLAAGVTGCDGRRCGLRATGLRLSAAARRPAAGGGACAIRGVVAPLDCTGAVSGLVIVGPSGRCRCAGWAGQPRARPSLRRREAGVCRGVERGRVRGRSARIRLQTCTSNVRSLEQTRCSVGKKLSRSDANTSAVVWRNLMPYVAYRLHLGIAQMQGNFAVWTTSQKRMA